MFFLAHLFRESREAAVNALFVIAFVDDMRGSWWMAAVRNAAGAYRIADIGPGRFLPDIRQPEHLHQESAPLVLRPPRVCGSAGADVLIACLDLPGREPDPALLITLADDCFGARTPPLSPCSTDNTPAIAGYRIRRGVDYSPQRFAFLRRLLLVTQT